MTHDHFRGCLRFSFAELKKPAIYIFFWNLHLLSFPTIYSLPCFPLKWRAHEYFTWGHPRRSGVTLSKTHFQERLNSKILHNQCATLNSTFLKFTLRIWLSLIIKFVIYIVEALLICSVLRLIKQGKCNHIILCNDLSLVKPKLLEKIYK